MTADDGPRRRRPRVRPLHGGGLVVGVVFAMLAMTPSLLPRDWLFQGLVSGISGAIGYGVGVLLAWLLRRSSRWRSLVARADAGVPPRARRWVVPALCLAGAAALLVMLAVAARWQRELTDAMGMPATTTSGWLRAAPVLVLVAAVLIAAARAVRLVSRAVARFLRRRLRLPGVVASVVGAVVVALAGSVEVGSVEAGTGGAGGTFDAAFGIHRGPLALEEAMDPAVTAVALTRTAAEVTGLVAALARRAARP